MIFNTRHKTKYFNNWKISHRISDSFGIYMNGFSHLGITNGLIFLQNGSERLFIKSLTLGLNSGGDGQSKVAMRKDMIWAAREFIE